MVSSFNLDCGFMWYGIICLTFMGLGKIASIMLERQKATTTEANKTHTPTNTSVSHSISYSFALLPSTAVFQPSQKKTFTRAFVKPCIQDKN